MKIALLHRHTKDTIKETNAAFPFLQGKVDVLTFKSFNRKGGFWKEIKSVLWIFYAPFLVWGKGYDVIYCDDSYPFYSYLVKLASPKSRVILRIGDLHLFYYFSGRVLRFLHSLEKIAWQKADGIIAISEAMAEYIASETLRGVDVVLDPVNLEDFKYVEGPGDGSVMFHGVLNRNKNIDLLIEAAYRLHDVDFTVVGDGPDMKRLTSIAPKNVFFKGWVPFKHIDHYISECSVGLSLRSDNPGNEYVVTSPFLQYGVMGRPCLVTRRKVFGDYPWQFSTVDEMVEKIKILLEKPEEGKKLREYIIKNHDAEKIAEEIWSVLSS